MSKVTAINIIIKKKNLLRKYQVQGKATQFRKMV
jgi:hypothetical protein